MDFTADFAASTAVTVTESFYTDPECPVAATSFDVLQVVSAQDGETFTAPTVIIAALPTIVLFEYPNLTPDQASLGTEFGIVSNIGGLTLII